MLRQTHVSSPSQPICQQGLLQNRKAKDGRKDAILSDITESDTQHMQDKLDTQTGSDQVMNKVWAEVG